MAKFTEAERYILRDFQNATQRALRGLEAIERDYQCESDMPTFHATPFMKVTFPDIDRCSVLLDACMWEAYPRKDEDDGFDSGRAGGVAELVGGPVDTAVY